MKPVWLIEAGVYGAEAEPLRAEIRRQGMVAEVIPHRSLKEKTDLVVGGHPLAEGCCVLGYGTFPFAREIQVHCRWVPGAWCDSANLDCTTYFAYFGKFLLNQPYAILPGVEAIRQQNWLFESFGKDEGVFARPAGGNKLFTGRCIQENTFASALSPTRYDPATLVVIAAPRSIEREWHFVVAGDEVVAVSQYAEDGEKRLAPECPDSVRSYVAKVLEEVRWRPDPIFMLDVCESEGSLGIVELNGFSCSWIYHCDPEAVVRKASELAESAWDRG